MAAHDDIKGLGGGVRDPDGEYDEMLARLSGCILLLSVWMCHGGISGQGCDLGGQQRCTFVASLCHGGHILTVLDFVQDGCTISQKAPYIHVIW